MKKNIYDNLAKNEKAVGITSVIASKEKIIDTYCYGQRSRENNLPATPDTIYRIASISKVIVAIAILMLHDEHRY